MRLDLFLKVSRLCSRRSIAQKLCDAGLVSINGRPAKSAHNVKVEDVITMRIRNHLLTVRVNLVPTARSVSKTAATDLYEIVKDEELSESQS
jgi:ribosomal 50S subunit-recycling heat shock protein